MFNLGFNDAVVTKSTCLAIIGYNCFALGLLNIKKMTSNSDVMYKKYSLQIINVLLWVFVFLELLKIFFFHENDSYTGGSGGIWSYIDVLNAGILFSGLTIICYNELYISEKLTVFRLYQKNRITFILIVLDVIITLLTGSRTLFLEIVILVITIFLLITYKRISLFQMLFLFLLGFVFLSLVMVLRSRDSNVIFHFNLLDMAMDLIINNFTLYICYDYVKKNGVVLFPFIGPLLSAIPFLSGVVCRLFGISSFKAFSAIFFSHLIFPKKIEFGVGTNIISSIYLSTGVIGVIFFMYLLGFLVGFLREKVKNRNSSIIELLIFLELSSVSVYIVRADYFCWVGNFIFALLFIYISNSRIIFTLKGAK